MEKNFFLWMESIHISKLMNNFQNYELFNLGYARISTCFVHINLFPIFFIESLILCFAVLVTFVLLKIHNYRQKLFPFYFINYFPTVLLLFTFFFYSYFIKLSFSCHHFLFNIPDFHRSNHLFFCLKVLDKLSYRYYFPYFLINKAFNVYIF
jgi:hypothetical protein